MGKKCPMSSSKHCLSSFMINLFSLRPLDENHMLLFWATTDGGAFTKFNWRVTIHHLTAFISPGTVQSSHTPLSSVCLYKKGTVEWRTFPSRNIFNITRIELSTSAEASHVPFYFIFSPTLAYNFTGPKGGISYSGKQTVRGTVINIRAYALHT